MGYSDISTRKPPLSRHPAFMPLIAVWLAALLGGSIAVLPTGVIGAGMAQAPFAVPAFAANPIAMAGLAALLGAGLGWAVARAISAVQHLPDKSVSAIEHSVSETEEAEAVEAQPVEPLRIVELEEVAQPVVEWEVVKAEVIEPEVVEDLGSEQALGADDIAPEPQAYDDAPFYADIDLSELLGAPRVEAAEPSEAPIDAEMAAGQIPVAQAEPETMPATVPETVPLPVATQPKAKLPQHGKAVNLLRAHDTQELAMPQLIERFAVALDDQRRLAEGSAHSYSPPVPPSSMTQRLRALVEVPPLAE
ncbi:MAG: hypothetical protein HKP43_08730 [Altererythrobacter sp.]|nr:hypothetical protein [Altererythrobacter sp.]